MPKKIVFVEVPYMGITSEGHDWKFGFKELLRPDCDAEFYLGKEGKGKIKDLIKDKKDGGDVLVFSGGISAGIEGGAGVGVAAAGGAVIAGAVFFPAAAAYGALAWKGAGERRAFKSIAKRMEKGEIPVKELDLGEFYEIGKELEDSNAEYMALWDARQEYLGKGVRGWARRNFSKFEDDEMRDYRVNIILPVFEELKGKSFQKWQETGEKAYFRMYEAYQRHAKTLGRKKRL